MKLKLTVEDRKRRIFVLQFIRVIALVVLAGVCYLALELGYNSSTTSTSIDSSREDTERSFSKDLIELVESLDVNAVGELDLGMVLNIFTRRENAFLIYVGMIILILLFARIYDNRVRQLIAAEREIIKIDETIFSPDSNPSKNIEKLIESGETSGRYRRLILDLFKSFQQEGNKSFFDFHYHNHLYAEEGDAGQFRIKMQRTNVWIIRMGILGTLIGLAVAFFELYDAVGTIDASEETLKISSKFVFQVQHALLGNVVAVGTSIAAHMITLMVEVLLASLILRRSNITWIKSTYDWALAYEGFSTKETELSDSIRKMNSKVTTSLGYMDDLNTSLNAFTPSLNKAKEEVDSVTKGGEKLVIMLNQSESTMSGTRSTIKKLGETTSQIDTKLVMYGGTIDGAEKISQKISKTMSGVDRRADKLDKSLSDLTTSVEELGSTADKNNKSMTTLDDRVITTSKTLEKLRDKAISKLHAGLQRAADILKETFNAKRWD